MIPIKSPKEIDRMRRAGRVAGLALREAGLMAKTGVTTAEIDAAVKRVITSHGATPTFLGYRGFPASACISVNEEVIHGIPGKRRLKEGDIVSIDVGAFLDGFHGDTARTFAVGKVSGEASRLMEVTKDCFFSGLSFAREGYRVSDISRAVQETAHKAGYGIVRDFTGHGVGRELHEEPSVPNCLEDGRRGARLFRGMTICIEPMINEGTGDIKILKDRWTVVTADGKLSSHYEHTVLITSGEPELLTMVD